MVSCTLMTSRKTHIWVKASWLANKPEGITKFQDSTSSWKSHAKDLVLRISWEITLSRFATLTVAMISSPSPSRIKLYMVWSTKLDMTPLRLISLVFLQLYAVEEDLHTDAKWWDAADIIWRFNFGKTRLFWTLVQFFDDADFFWIYWIFAEIEYKILFIEGTLNTVCHFIYVIALILLHNPNVNGNFIRSLSFSFIFQIIIIIQTSQKQTFSTITKLLFQMSKFSYEKLSIQ